MDVGVASVWMMSNGWVAIDTVTISMVSMVAISMMSIEAMVSISWIS